jgi:D-3-phosphoglycerate dehydrogenase
MKQVYCLNNISKVGLSVLPTNYQLITDVNHADAILVRSAAMHEMELPNSVLAVARAGAGVNNIPLDKYGKSGVVVFNTPGANANAVKELMIAGMLLASRDIYGGMKWLEANKADDQIAKTVEKEKARFGGTEIFGKTIGIIGLGAIGLLLAHACSALGMKVIASDQSLAYLETKRSQLPNSIQLVETKEEVFQVADFISLNLPLNASTKGMINKQSISMMKDGVIILNFARDSLVNDDELEVELQSRKVRSYITDFPNAKTVNMDHVIAIPHLGASTDEAEDNCAMMASRQIVDYLEDGVIVNSVNYPMMNIGPKKMKHRICVLHDALIDLLTLIPTTSNNSYGVFQKKNDTFGYTIVETDSDYALELKKVFEQQRNVYRVRLI